MASFFAASYANTILSNLMSNAYIGLHMSSVAPANAATGFTGISEPATANGYARKAASIGSFSTSNGTIRNTQYIYFDEDVNADWGTAYYIIISGSSNRAATDTAARYVGELSSATTITANTVPLFRPQSLAITITDTGSGT